MREMEGKEMKEEKWKEEYKIRQKQNEIAEEIKNELLKKAETEHQRNVIKEIINGIKRKHRFDYLKKQIQDSMVEMEETLWLNQKREQLNTM